MSLARAAADKEAEARRYPEEQLIFPAAPPAAPSSWELISNPLLAACASDDSVGIRRPGLRSSSVPSLVLPTESMAGYGLSVGRAARSGGPSLLRLPALAASVMDPLVMSHGDSGLVPAPVLDGRPQLQRSSSGLALCIARGCPDGEHGFVRGNRAEQFVNHIYDLRNAGTIDDTEFDRCMRDGNAGNPKKCATCLTWFGSMGYLRLHRRQHLCSSPRVLPVTPSAAASSLSSTSRGCGGGRVAAPPVFVQPRSSLGRGGMGRARGGHAAAAAVAAPRLTRSRSGEAEDAPTACVPTVAPSVATSAGRRGADVAGASALTPSLLRLGEFAHRVAQGGIEIERLTASVAAAGPIDDPAELSDGELEMLGLHGSSGLGSGRFAAQRVSTPPPRAAAEAGSQAGDEEGEHRGPLPPPLPDGGDDGSGGGDPEPEPDADGDGDGHEHVPVDRVAACVVKKLRRHVTRLDHFPPWMTLTSEVQAAIAVALRDILEATDPESFFLAWLAFFDMPDAMFALNDRGGRHRGKFRHNAQAAGLAAREWINRHDADPQGELPDGFDGDDTFHERPVGEPRGRYEEDAARIKAAREMLRRGPGYVSQAFKRLNSDPIPAASNDTFTKFAPMFPNGDLTLNPPIPESHTPLVVGGHADILGVIKSLAGKAAGPSCWAPDLFLVMKDNQHLLGMYGECLANLTNKREWMTTDLAQLILGARLLGANKPSGDEPRPIVVSEATWSHLQLIALRQIDKQWLLRVFEELGRTIQFGVGVRAGVEKAFRVMETALLCAYDLDIQNWGILLEDARAAFQHMKRAEMLDTIYSYPELKPMWHVAELAFNWAAPRYVLMDDGTVRIIMQSEGGGQGWVLMCLAWCLAHLKTLKRMARAGCPDGECNEVAAVVDDTNLGGSHTALRAALEVSKEEYPTILGLSLNLPKTMVVVPDLDSSSDDNISGWHDEGIAVVTSAKLLGGCLSTDDAALRAFIASRIDPETGKIKDVLRRLAHPDMDPQMALIVATRGVQHWVDYIIRVTPPSLAAPFLERFDKALLDIMIGKLGLTELNEGEHLPEWDARVALVRQQMQLPVRFSGLGLRPSALVSLAAYLASLAAGAEETLGVAQRMTRLSGGNHDDGDPDNLLPQRYRSQYAYCRENLIALAPNLEDLTFSTKDDPDGADQLKCLPPQLHNFLRIFQLKPALATRFQKRLMEHVWHAWRESISTTLSLGPDRVLAAGDVARIDAYSKPTAGKELTLIPMTAMTTFAAAEICQVVRGRLGQMPAPHFYMIEGPIICREGDRVDIKRVPAHPGKHCASGRRMVLTNRHDGAAQVFCTVAERNGVPTEWTPYLDGGKVLDIAFSFPDGVVLVDVTIRATDAPCYEGEARRRGADGVLLAADNSKEARYANLVNSPGRQFVPLSFLDSGAYGKPVGMLLKRLCQAGETNGTVRPVDLKTAREWLAVAIQRGNARAALWATARMRAVGPSYKASMAARRRNRARRHVHGGGVGEG